MNLLTALLALLLASLFSLAHPHSFATLLLAYVSALALLEVGLRTPMRAALQRLAKECIWLALASLTLCILLLPGLRGLTDREGLLELAPRLSDRLALTNEVTFAPPLLRFDQPQTFFARTSEDAAQAVLVVSDQRHEGQALRHGVFRFDVHVQGSTQAFDEAFPVMIEVDGTPHTQHVLAVSPLAHPSRIGVGNGKACIISEETDEMRILDEHGALSTPFHPGDGPVACAFSGESIVILLRYELYITSMRDGTWRRGAEIGLGATAMARTNSHLAVLVEGLTNEFLLLDAEGMNVLARMPLVGVPIDLATTGDVIFIATRSPARIHRIQVQGNALRLTQTRALAMPAFAITANADSVVLASTDYRDLAEENPGNHFIEDQLIWLDTTSLVTSRIEPTARRTARQDHAGDVDRGLSPISLAFDEEGALLVAFAGSFELARFPRSGLPTYLDMRRDLGMPRAFVQVGGHYVATSPSEGQSATLDRSLRVLRVDAWGPSTQALRSEDPNALRVRMGEQAFWEGTRAGASCQSCHLLGATDGEAHNIGQRILAPTLDVRGLEGTAPFLRDGSYPALGDLYEVAVEEYRGYRTHAGNRQATLDAFMRTLPLPHIESPRAIERERRGLDAFFEARCAECHTPPAFTNLSRHAARDLFPDAVLHDESISLDVPSLRALRTSAPYLFDGRAETLGEVLIEHNASRRHGDAISLSDEAQRDLLFFLESL